MMMHDPSVAGDFGLASPGSPPGMTASKSSKSSSLHSFESCENDGIIADANHFEEIGLDDDTTFQPRHLEPAPFKIPPSPYSPTYASDTRSLPLKSASTPRLQYSREHSRSRLQQENAATPKARPPFPSLHAQVRSVNGRSPTLGATSELYPSSLPLRGLGIRPAGPNGPLKFRAQRSPSPNLMLAPKSPNLLVRPRRSSWQSNRDRKTPTELELECDEDDGDDIPDGLVLDNVPISPRPMQERAKSQPNSKAPSPERGVKERARNVGNGTPPVAVARGSLRSPAWKSDTLVAKSHSEISSGIASPLKTRNKSWTEALNELNSEAKVLTEKLEEHASELEHRAQRCSTGSMPAARRSVEHIDSKPRHKSALAELPPLRRTEIIVDPLPISKEKEAVLSRTRPSWLPPKDPAEEKKHVREYQKMMAYSVEADRRREAARRDRSECRDTEADSLMQLWEHDIIPRWTEAIRERRTRDLWWRGIASRSRAQVWTRAIGNELGLTEKSFHAALERARETEARVKAGTGSSEDVQHAAWFNAIRGDVEERTWRDLRIFQAGGPLHQSLLDVLSAYAMYRSDIGYLTGCNTIAALLLLNLPNPTAAFIALSNILNRNLPLSFYASDHGSKASAYNLLLQRLAQESSNLHEHLLSLPNHDPNVYLCDVFTSLFTRNLTLDKSARLWDIYVFEGDAILVRAAVALLLQQEMALLGTKDMNEVKRVLERAGGINQSGPVLVSDGEEEKWIRAVRET